MLRETRTPSSLAYTHSNSLSSCLHTFLLGKLCSMAVAFVASSKDATGWLLESCNYAERMAVGPTSEGWTQVLHYKLV